MPRWNASGKRLVMLWMRQIALNRLTHINESVRQSTLSDRLNVALIIFTGGSALGAVVNLVSTILPDELKWLVVMFSCIVIGLSVVATILAGVLQILKPGDKAEKNRQLGVQYNNLSNIMQKESVIDDPKPLAQFLEDVIDRFSYIQNYGTEVMQDQASTADLPNLILLKDAERRRRMRAKMEGKSTPSPSGTSTKSPIRRDLKIIDDRDHALFDGSDYTESYQTGNRISAEAAAATEASVATEASDDNSSIESSILNLLVNFFQYFFSNSSHSEL